MKYLIEEILYRLVYIWRGSYRAGILRTGALTELSQLLCRLVGICIATKALRR